MTSSTLDRTPGEGREAKGKGMRRRLLSKMKTVLKKADLSSRQPAQEPAATAPTRPAAAPTVVAEPSTAPVAEPTPSQPHISTKEDTAHEPHDDASAAGDVEKIPRAQIYSERAQHLAHFGLEMDLNDRYRLDGHVLRVHKPLRMRVHRQCHQCGNDISTTGACDKCSHDYCQQCTRYPPKRDEAEKVASREKRADMMKKRAADATISPDWSAPNAAPPVIVRKPGKAGAQQKLVYKKVRQRVRRMCCQCQEAGDPEVQFHGSRNCPKCDHVRCTDCPRDPAKKTKYPYGYPGDEFGPKSTPHYRCHECFTDYPPGAEDGAVCSKCSHAKCSTCERLKPQKVESKPDPEVVRSVQEKLAVLTLSHG